MLATIILAITGLAFQFSGFIIWRFKLPGVVAGYDPNQIRDPEGLASWTGKSFMCIGTALQAIALTNYWVQSDLSEVLSYVALMILSIAAGVLALAGVQRYHK